MEPHTSLAWGGHAGRELRNQFSSLIITFVHTDMHHQGAHHCRAILQSDQALQRCGSFRVPILPSGRVEA